MANEFINMPTEENREILGKIFDLQKQLLDVIHKQATTYEKIGHINLDLEHRAKERYKVEKANIEDNLADTLAMERELIQLRGITDKTERILQQQSLSEMAERISVRNLENSLIRQAMTYEQEIETLREKERSKWGFFLKKIASEQFKLNGGFFGELANVKNITAELQKHPYSLKAGAVWVGVLVTYLKGAWELFQRFDTAAWNVRKAIGMTRDDMREIRKSAERIAVDYAHIGVTAEMAYNAYMNLGKEMGSIHIVSGDLVKNAAVLQSQLGVSVEHSTGFLRNMASISKSSMESKQDMMYIAADMSRAAGIPLNEVMGDIATASGKTLTMMSRLPNVVLRSAIEAKRMGTSLRSMAESSRSLLDFQESVNAEMDASVLLGRAVNLQRARELAYRRDLEGSTKEILRITKQMDFENMDVFQQEAFAKATGRSVDELVKMVQAERQLEKARRDPNLKGKVEAYERLRDANSKFQKDSAKNYELELNRNANQERLVAISNKWNRIMMKAQTVFLPIIDGILVAVNGLMEVGVVVAAIVGHIQTFGAETMKALSGVIHIGKTVAQLGKSIKALGVDLKASWIWKLGDAVQTIGSTIASWQRSLSAAFNFSKVGKFFGEIFARLGEVGKFFAKIGSWIGKAFSFLGKFGAAFGKFGGLLAGFGKFIPIIGWVITGFQLLGNLFERFSSIEFVKGDWVGNIWKGIKAIGGALYDTLIQPFVDAWNWIKGIFVGNSPSRLALGILNGIVSVGAMMFDALTAPWRRALAWIAEKIPGMGKVAEKLRGGMGGMVESVERRVTAGYTSTVAATPQDAKIAKQQQQQITAEKNNEQVDNSKLLQCILDGIVQLNRNLESGKIGFYVDGQLLSATIARQTEFRGGFGTNRI
jgi:hypothetical protein